jgi:hypothetical protein
MSPAASLRAGWHMPEPFDDPQQSECQTDSPESGEDDDDH